MFLFIIYFRVLYFSGFIPKVSFPRCSASKLKNVSLFQTHPNSVSSQNHPRVSFQTYPNSAFCRGGSPHTRPSRSARRCRRRCCRRTLASSTWASCRAGGRTTQHCTGRRWIPCRLIRTWPRSSQLASTVRLPTTLATIPSKAALLTRWNLNELLMR